MIKAFWRRFLSLDFWLKLIWLFCLFGAVLNLVYVCHDVRHDGLLLRLHTGFLALYAGQAVFILMKERMVFVLSLLQAFLAFLTNADFTFVPLVRLLGRFVYAAAGGFSVEQMEVYKYVFISLCLTLELLKTWFLFALLPAPKKKDPAPVPPAQV